MARKPVYSVDSSALIHAWRRVYRPKNFGFVWDGFDSLIEEGRLRASIEVYNELEKKDDELFAWCKERKEKLFCEIDDDIQKVVREILRDHPRLVDTVKGRSGADPFVIALAETANPFMVVLTEETRGKIRIPDVCDARRVKSQNLADMIEDEDWKSGR
jgi:adenylate kinase